MRPSFVVSLMLLSFFLTKAQGIRLEKGSFAAQQHNKHDEEDNLLRREDSSDDEAVLCKDEKCTGKIKNRKLFTTSVSTIHAISKNVKNGGTDKEEEIKVNKQQEVPHEHNPDLVDIVDMDYSPARRKTPIHN
ncbi:uncharacterized protein LOC130723918 [Lotus japonicus]|uniref:uncharacterized protein LOC130723918 n=1 Tax=Lotus japonicus TaxID=34305 RepID=UPI00258D63B9|nr:uncharacterized protein LOC130723918 [Lotus japonicus]